MTTDQILSLIVAIFPNAMTIITMVSVIVRVCKDFKALKKQVTDMKAVEDMNIKMNEVIKENYELKKKINELLTKIDHIERK